MSAMTRYVLTASIVCTVVVLAVFVSLSEAQQQGAGETCDNDADCARSRHRRSPCSGSTYTMSRLIEIIEQLEKNVKGQTAQDYIRYLRKFIYANSSFLSRKQWDYVCGQLKRGSMPNDALTEEEREDLAQMIIHGNKTDQEKGVVWTKHSDTVAAGHVVTGISCGGFNRDAQLDIAKWWSGASSSLDNLFFVTISGDMGQTSLQFSSDKKTRKLFGPAGQWNDLSCPKEYTLPSPVSELTDAEVRGDIDGIILGTLIPMIKGRGWKLSRIFRDYYQNGGIQVGSRLFSATNRNERFGELVSDVELEAQSKAFAEAYYKPDRKVYKGRSLKSLLPDIPNAIQQFYKDYVPCNEELKTKYTIQYFIKLLKELEKKKNLGLYEMTQAIVGMNEYFTSSYLGAMLDVDDHGHKYTDHLAWYVLRELVSHGFSPSTPRRELGVIEAGGDVVAIGHVLAGIHAGVGRTSLYGATVAGSLARAAVNREAASKKTLDTMGATGTWDRSNCPVIKYMLKRSIKSAQHTTRAELLGDIDGFVLGHRVPDWLRAESRLKLSTALERYYGKAFNPVSGQVRFEQLKTYIDKSKLITETTIACTKIKKKNADWYQLSVDSSFCKAAAEGAVTKFYKTVFLSKDEAKTSYESQMLPDYKTLVTAYPGDKAEGGVISGSDLRSKLAGSRSIDKSQAAVDSLRISVMLNKLFGHRIPKTQSHKSVISEGRVYIYDLATLKGYLTEKYGGPVAEFSGKSGILMVERSDGSGVSVGVWDGTKMHQMAHRSRQAKDKVYLWKANGCSTQADGGSCQFYQCTNWAAPCGTSGYVLGYGFRYCRQFHSLYNKFDKEGQLWADDVRTCLMQEVESLHKRRFSCDQFKRSAFDSHAGCYERSKHFCKMASAAKNRDVLFDIFEPDNLWDFWGYTAWTQVLDTLKHCKKHVSQSVMNDIINFIKQAGKKLQQSLSSKQQDEGAKKSSVDPEDSSTCVSYANAGDCRFYQCFQQKFPCSVFDASHVTDFEFPLCEDLQNQNLMLDYGGEQWLKKTNKCLMAKLLSLYHETSVSCVDLHSVMFDGRADCLVDAGFCDILASKRNSFAVDTGTNLWSYPSLLPDKPGLTLAGRDYFYSELSSLRRLMGHTGKACG